MAFRRTMRWLRCAGCAAGVGCLAAVLCGTGVLAASDTSTRVGTKRPTQKKLVALSPWEQAERGREALEAIPDASRTKADYARAMDAYRAIYHANPQDAHAAASVNAVAELLAEQGRGMHDAKASQAAVGQYKFLRTQYPGSSLGVEALLAEGQIAQNDLNDPAAAREKYALLLKTHAKSEQAEEARAGLASLEQGSGVRGQGTSRAAGHAVSQEAGPQGLKLSSRGAGDGTAEAVPFTRETASGNRQAAGGRQPSGERSVGGGRSASGDRSQGSSLPAMAQTSGGGVAAPDPVLGASPTSQNRDAGHPQVVGRPAGEVDLALVDAETRPVETIGGPSHPMEVRHAAAGSGGRALVTGIRHWSTATYTRVAIDLGDSVTYEAARVPNPDRLYFDLHGTRLAQELVGKSFTVTDDGFLKKIRAAQFSDDMTRVVLDVNDVTEYSAFLLPNPTRLIIDIHGRQGLGQKDQSSAGPDVSAAAGSAELAASHAAGVAKVTAAKPVPNTTATKQASATEVAAVSASPGRVEATTRPTSKPISEVVAATGAGMEAPSLPIRRDETAMNGAPGVLGRTKKAKGAKGAVASAAEATPARAAVPMADGQTSLVRALGLKIGRIVIDAGHGGHDSGTLGADGIQEKDVVLDVALRVGKLLHDCLGAEIIYTRSDDTFIPLETRTAIANKAQADLFLSIHANSSSDAGARGVETYYLNFTSDASALETAARENAVSDQSIHQLSDLVKKIALKDKIEESREFAADVETSLYAGLQKGNAGLKDRGVKKAPFVVLIGANMPSILAEISFVTNPKDAEQLREPEYRQRVAESLYKGVARYEGGLSGSRVATERAGQ